MSPYDLSRVPDAALVHTFLSDTGTERRSIAKVVAKIAEIDARKLYLGAGYPSMYTYCVDLARYSEDEAYHRIRVARIAREHPAIFPMLADARLNLTSVLRLGAYLTRENASELLAAAAGTSKSELEEILATRFPRTELLPFVAGPVSPRSDREHVPERVATPAPVAAGPAIATPVPAGHVAPASTAPPTRMPAPLPPQRLTPIAAERFGWQFSSGRALRDKFRRAQELMNCTDIEQIFDAALDALNEKLEKRRCGAALRPRTAPMPASKNPRHIPNVVRRAVWKRDKGQCSFVGDSGHRCESRMGLELDHIVPIARGGTATLDNIRLLCRAHNQHEAECTYGTVFMNGKREAARQGAATNPG
jgi:5-methylcytosine-specific restriction protein A